MTNTIDIYQRKQMKPDKKTTHTRT